MRTFLICLAWSCWIAIGAVCIYAGICLNEICKDLENTEPWWEKLGDEPLDL